MNWLLDVFWWLLAYIGSYIADNPVHSIIFAAVILRMFGTTVDTGWKGVLFSAGRVRKVLEPGFHPLIPFIQRVRKVPTRSVTLHLPMQRITTADGLVYDVQANLVYRIDDPIKAVVQVGDYRKGFETVLPIIIQELLGSQLRGQLQERKALEEEFTVRADAKLQRWGVAVEQAGFMSIAPTSKTLRLTQLNLLTKERERALRRYLDNGLAPELAVTLLGADRKACSHSSVRYRGRSRRIAALHKAYLKPFLAEEQQRMVTRLMMVAHSREAAVALAAADPAVLELATARAHQASRESAASRRHHAAIVAPAPTQLE